MDSGSIGSEGSRRVRQIRRGTFLTHLSYYSAGRYLSEFLWMIRGMVLAGLLGPSLFGFWTKMKILLVFLQYAQLGTHEAMARELPNAIARDDRETAGRIKGSVISFNLLTSAVAAVVIATAIFLALGRQPESDLVVWLLFLGVVFPTTQLYGFLLLRLRAEKSFAAASRSMVAVALLSTLLGCGGAYFFGLQGFLVGLGLSNIAVLLAQYLRGLPFPHPRPDIGLLKSLLRIGFPVMASGLVMMALRNVDKLAIWWLLTRESLGIYALPTYVIVLVMMIPEAVAAVIYPHLVGSVAVDETGQALQTFFVRPTLIISYLAAPTAGVLFLVLHLPIRWLLPQYTLGITPGRILVAAVFFAAIARIPQLVLITLNRQKKLLTLNLLALGVALPATITLIISGLGLVGAALGAALSFIVHSFLVLTAALRSMKMPTKRIVSLLSTILVPYLTVGIAVAFVVWLLPDQTESLGWDLVYSGLRCIIILAIGTFLATYAHRRLGLEAPVATSIDPVP